MKDLDALRDELQKCVKCGTCRSVCPVFWALGRETASMRGKLALVRGYIDGEIELNDTYLKHIKECTLCGACKSNCPNGVDTTRIITAARADAVKKQGVPFAASLIFKNLLESGKLMSGALKLASRLQGILFKDSVEAGLLSRFSLPVIGGGRLLPPLAKTFFMDMTEVRELGNQEKPKDKSRPRIAFYSGCGINFLMPEVGLSTLDVLKRAGAETIVPAGQVCCGMPAYSMGDVVTARSMALKTLEAFEAYEYDLITTSCATCGYGLKKLFRDLLDDTPEMKKRVEAFSSKVRDISELLIHELHYKGKGKGENTLVTYHDPCHLGRAQGLREEPRELIVNSSGAKLKEMKHPCSCCGLGGGLSVANYELSVEITRRKAESIKDSGADTVVTGCPGCIVQLRDGLHKYGVNARVKHVVELL